MSVHTDVTLHEPTDQGASLPSTGVTPPPVADTSDRRRGAGSRVGRALKVWIPPLLTLVVVLCIWLYVSYEMLDESRRFLMPPPQDVVSEGFLDGRNLSEILAGLWSTTKVALVGLSISIVVGMTFAIIMSQARWIERSFYPYAVIIQTIPILALVPLVGFWWGFDFRSRVLVCVLISLFPIITNTLFGLKSTDKGMHDLFTLHGANRQTRLRKLQLPNAMPAIFTGFRISAGLSVIGAIVGDFFFRQGQPGIGRLLDIYRANLQSELLLAAVFFSSMLGVVVFWIFGILARRTTGHWDDSQSY
jgi:NitT/TauT family transport system permease protein